MTTNSRAKWFSYHRDITNARQQTPTTTRRWFNETRGSLSRWQPPVCSKSPGSSPPIREPVGIIRKYACVSNRWVYTITGMNQLYKREERPITTTLGTRLNDESLYRWIYRPGGVLHFQQACLFYLTVAPWSSARRTYPRCQAKFLSFS